MGPRAVKGHHYWPESGRPLEAQEVLAIPTKNLENPIHPPQKICEKTIKSIWRYHEMIGFSCLSGGLQYIWHHMTSVFFWLPHVHPIPTPKYPHRSSNFSSSQMLPIATLVFTYESKRQFMIGYSLFSSNVSDWEFLYKQRFFCRTFIYKCRFFSLPRLSEGNHPAVDIGFSDVFFLLWFLSLTFLCFSTLGRLYTYTIHIYITQMLYGAGIFTYISGWFLG